VKPLFVVGALLSLSGCSAGFGIAGGPELNRRHGVVTGEGSLVTKPFSTPMNAYGPLFGAELQGRFESEIGSRFTTGLRLGWGENPEPVSGSVGWEAHVDAGVPFGRGGFAPDWSYYLGATTACSFWISKSHQGADLNDSSWFFKRALELSPFVRFRAHLDGSECHDCPLDLTFGVSLRLRLVNDFL
jgi:hypothetical protein